MSQSCPTDAVLDGGHPTDVVILVVGLTKAGKSSFLNELLGRQLCAVGKKMPSCTENVSSYVMHDHEVPSAGVVKLLDGRRLVLVDTPGFDHSYAEDYQVLDKISAWLAKSYRQEMRISAILYLHDVSNDDSESVVDRSLALFTKLCGEDAMDQVAFVTTKWDRRKDIEEVMDRVKELEDKSWSDTFRHGASLFHAQPKSKESLLSTEHKRPWDIVYQVLLSAGKRGPGRILRIQEDMVKKGLLFGETGAGQEMRRRKSTDLRKILQKVKEVYRHIFY